MEEIEGKGKSGPVDHTGVKPQFTQLNDQSAVWHGGQFSHLNPHLIERPNISINKTFSLNNLSQLKSKKLGSKQKPRGLSLVALI